MIRSSKRNYYFDKFNAVKSDLKKTWTLVNSILGKKKAVTPKMIIHNDEIIDEPAVIANVFNNYFSTVGSNVLKSIPDSCNNFSDFLRGDFSHSIYIKPVTQGEVIEIVKKMSTSQSFGYDGVNAVLLKSVIKYIVYH